jgi:2-polyprenyl-6-methoxyphenol hydroxylase-like FAD-dependent oxidoreductase
MTTPASTPEQTVDVLIVGGGGAGLTASMLLSHLGVEHLLVSAMPTTSVLPKAHVLNQRTMEILEDAGVAGAIARGARRRRTWRRPPSTPASPEPPRTTGDGSRVSSPGVPAARTRAGAPRARGVS